MWFDSQKLLKKESSDCQVSKIFIFHGLFKKENPSKNISFFIEKSMENKFVYVYNFSNFLYRLLLDCREAKVKVDS